MQPVILSRHHDRCNRATFGLSEADLGRNLDRKDKGRRLLLRINMVTSDPAFRPALLTTAAIFLFGFGYLELTTYLLFEADSPPPGLSALVPFVTAVAFGSCLVFSVIITAGWRRWQRWALIATMFFVIIAVQSIIDIANMWLIAQRINPLMQSWAQFDLNRFLRATFIYFWVYLVDVVLVMLVIASYRLGQHREALAQARAEAAQAQLAMLRYQLNPHFLFNTLNAISTLVVTARNEEAEDMLARLSSFLRASLTSEPNAFVRLDVEMDVIEEYLEIEGVRFGDRLAVEFACEEDAAPMLVPSFILQPLVENAIKYAVGPSRRTINLRIEARIDGDDLVILIGDDGDGNKEATRNGTGVGLRNVRERLRTLYGERGVLEAVPLDQGFLAIVRLPAYSEAEPGAQATCRSDA